MAIIRNSEKFPRIRIDLEPFRYEDQHQNTYIGFMDPLKLSPHRVLIPPDLYALVPFFDGSHSLDMLEKEYQSQFRRSLDRSRLVQMVKMLDKALLLNNDRFRAKKQDIITSFRALQERRPSCAGNSYPQSVDELTRMMDHFFESVGQSSLVPKGVATKSVKAFIAPHIDVRLGYPAYARVYQAMKETRQPDLYVIIGISHQHTEKPFVLTKKNFQTPLGTVETDVDFVEHLASRCKSDYFTDEIVHRDEHSIEFQTLFLKYSLEKKFKIVPILASFSHERSDAEEDQIKEFIRALKETSAEHGDVCYIASVDFAHLGLMYGDHEEPNPYLLARVEQFDKNVLNAINRLDIPAFERIFVTTGNKYHICGYPALRTLIGVLPPVNSLLLHYDNAIMDSHRSTVTFAGMLFY